MGRYPPVQGAGRPSGSVLRYRRVKPRRREARRHTPLDAGWRSVRGRRAERILCSNRIYLRPVAALGLWHSVARYSA
jgi:hypothetical protein